MASDKEFTRRAGSVASVILGGAAACCVLALLYTLYYYSWTHQRSFTSALGPLLFYVFPGVAAGALLAALRLKPAYRLKLAFAVASTAFSIYSLDAALVLTAVDPRVALARDFGTDFDTRSKLDVVEDLRRKRIGAATNIFPRSLLKKQPDGGIKSVLTMNGTEALPLGGIANVATVFCNEGGEYVIYQSDDHGFHNPPSMWQSAVDIGAIGDSFTEGFCVASDKGFVALLRKRSPRTLNLGKTGDGPLLELATLQEYLPPFRPKVVLWFFYEGNDLQDLMFEQGSPLLMLYLRGNFSQRLLHYQDSIDRVLEAFAAEQEHIERAKRFDAMKSVAKLSHLRSRLGMDVGSFEQPPAISDGAVDLLGQIVSAARNQVHAWGGELHFVYLPCRERFAGTAIASDDGTAATATEKTRYYDAVVAGMRARAIPVIDIVRVFESHRDALSLFPYRRSVHYTDQGNELVAEAVLRAIAPSTDDAGQRSN
jgi:SGNH hydrolase-like domain, acetyltransferase AlgX